jgi:hypothetical protein
MLAYEKNKKGVVILLITAGAFIGDNTVQFKLADYKGFMKQDHYLNHLKRNLKYALNIETDNNEEMDENIVRKRSQILWDFLSLLNIAQHGMKDYEIEQNDWLNIVNKLELTIEELLSLDMFDNEQQTTLMLFRDEKFNLIDLFDENQCLIGFCLQHNIKVLFNNALINSNVDKVFRTTIGHGEIADTISKLLYLKDLDSPLFVSLRLTPWFVCLIDVLSHVFYLIVMGLVCINDYGDKYGSDYSMTIHRTIWSEFEICLTIMLFSSILHEIGEVWDVNWSVKLYFEDEWNGIDTVSYLLGIVWFILRCIPNQFSIARIFLCLQAIPEAISLLRFLSLNQSLGVLVIMVEAMILELKSFIVLYLVTLTGVSIGLRGLFHGLDGYETNSNTVLTIFAMSFSVFDFFSSFQTSSPTVNVIGVLVLIGVLIMVPIILINLIIAQMTNSYQAVKDHAVREWGFSKARLVKQYVRRQEKNLLSTIPAPFNILVVMIGMVAYIYSMIAVMMLSKNHNKKEIDDAQAEDEQEDHISGIFVLNIIAINC